MSNIDARTANDAVAELLWRLEAQLDEAVATGGELLAALPTARRASNLPAIAGQAALEKFSQTLLAISEGPRPCRRWPPRSRKGRQADRL